MLTRFSSWSKAMLSVRDILPMPVVGFEASSPVLSNATKYPNFVRLQVSDTRNALALARLAKTMGFTSIYIVCEGTDSWAVDYKDAFVAAMNGSSTNVGYLNKNSNLTALIRGAEDVVKGMRGYSVVLVAAGSTIMKTSRFFEAFSATDVGTLPHAFLFASTSTLGKMAADPRLTVDARRVLDGSLALEVRLKESEMNYNETSDDSRGTKTSHRFPTLLRLTPLTPPPLFDCLLFSIADRWHCFVPSTVLSSTYLVSSLVSQTNACQPYHYGRLSKRRRPAL
jgi:hypothetical protein